MRVFAQVFCQKLKLAVGFDVAYLGEIGNGRNVRGQCLTKILIVFFVKHAKRGARGCVHFFFFFSENLSNSQAFPCPWPFRRIWLCFARGKALGLQNDPGS